MKALSLHQPYAALIRFGAKTIETRFWETKYRGPVLICSTQGFYPGASDMLKRFNWLLNEHEVMIDKGTTQCVVDIVDCRLGTSADKVAACCDLWAVNPKTGLMTQKYALVLEKIRPVVRKSIKCGRKWFNVADELIEWEPPPEPHTLPRTYTQ